MTVKQLQEEIIKLKNQKDVIILAHYYQPIEIQEIADYLGDSLGLSRTAKEKTNSEYIIFAGVDFMAETASILNQDKRVLIPNPESCCPMAAFLTQEKVIQYKKENPGVPMVTYINSTASVKAESNICCTSSNAVKITQRIAKEFNTEKVLFGPDANLADYVEQNLNIKTIKAPVNGHCYVHSQLTIADINKSRKNNPNGIILVHPECKREVRDMADFVGSTAHMYNRVKESASNEINFIIGTEKGLMERMANDFLNKKFTLMSEKMICYNMKKNSIELMKYVLENLDDNMFLVKVPSEIAKRALEPINKMLDYS
ncbi:MAG: quinolinate synthase NadA [Promethearchaeota archaeon]|jgi:quinolinate synthase